MSELKYEILKHCGVISGAGTSMEIQLNLISWGSNPPRYDLRPWKMSNGTKKPCKGIALKGEEVKRLKIILEGIEV